jgi:hypothetical protein
MDHDVKAVANVCFKLAREDKRYLTNLEYQRLVVLAQDLSMRTMGEPLWDGCWVESVDGRLVPNLWDALRLKTESGVVRGRLETKSPPIKEETPAWKVIRAAYMQFDYEQRHAASALNGPASGGITTEPKNCPASLTES